MKFVLLIILFAAVSFGAYQMHVQQLKETEEKAQLIAYTQTRSQIEQERALRQQRPQLNIARVIDPLILQVEMPMNLDEPADLLPVIQRTKQRIMDKSVGAEPARKVVYDNAAVALNYLAAVADERTKSLKAMLHNRAANSLALSKTDGATFFNQGVTKRWEQNLARARPVLAQLMDKLKASEREWNKEARQGGYPEEYDLSGLTPLMIPADAGPETTSPATPVSRVIRRINPNSTLQ